MKYPSLLLGGCSLACSLHAFAPHPTVLTVKFHDQMLPVLKVIDTDPVVLVEGAEKRIRTEPLYLAQRAQDYNTREHVDLIRMSLGGMRFGFVANKEDADSNPTPREGPRFGTTYFEAVVKSRNTLRQPFIALVAYTSNAFDPDAGDFSPAQIVVHDLPDLPAGQEVTVKFSAAALSQATNVHYFAQIFDSAGTEVPAGNMTGAWEYYSLLERAKLKGAMENYLAKFAGANHPATPVMMARPLFPDGATPPKGAVTALLTLTAAGTVSEVNVRGVEEAGVRRSITDALGGWLFLPQLKAGQPVATKVQVPLQF